MNYKKDWLMVFSKKKKKNWLMKFWIRLSEHNLKDTNYGYVPDYGTMTNTESCPVVIRYHPLKESLAIYEGPTQRSFFEDIYFR